MKFNVRSVFGVQVVTVALIMLVPSAAWSDEPEHEGLTPQELLGLKVEIASVGGGNLLTVPSTVTIVDNAMIREFNLQTVAEAVELVAGFGLVRTYLKRDLPTARGVMQDHYANKVLVMIDNVPTYHAVTGEGALSRVDIHDVDRIEVLKGPASVLYGTNAYAGAINIILKQPADYRSEAQFGFSNYWGFIAGGNVQTTIGGFMTMISANAVNTPSGTVEFTDEIGEEGRIEEEMSSRNFTLSAQRGGHSVLVNGYDASESFLGVVPRYNRGAGRDHLLRGALLNYTWAGGVGRGTGLFASATYDWNERDFSRSDDDVVRALIRGHRILGSVRAVVSLAHGLHLQTGIDAERRASTFYKNYNSRTGETIADNNMADRSVSELSAFFQFYYRKGPWSIVPGARYTNNELFGGNLSSRLAVVYQIGDRNSIKLLGGQSYRVPSLFELYFQTPSNTVYGNTELDPETNDTVELEWVGSAGNWYYEAIVYHAQYDNKIFRQRRYPTYSDIPADTSTIYVNGDGFSATGFEGSIRYRMPGNLAAFASYAWVNGDAGDEVENSDHHNFLYVPDHTFAGGLTKYVGPFWLTGVAKYMSDRGAPVETLGSQASFDFTLGYGHRIDSLVLRHLLSFKNLTNEDIVFPEYVRRILNEIPSGYGRRISYTLQVGF